MTVIKSNKSIRPVYISDSEVVAAAWSKNFATNLSTVAVRLGVPAALVAKVVANDAALQATMKSITDLEKWLSGFRTTKNGLFNGYPTNPTLPVPYPTAITMTTLPDPGTAYVFAPHIQAVTIILANPETTDSDKELLQLQPAEGLPTPPDAANRVKAEDYNYPLIKAVVGVDTVTIYFTRGDRWRGKAVILQVDREGKGIYTQLVNTTGGSFADSITLPADQLTAAWTYRAIYVNGTTLISDWSPELPVIVRREPGPFEE